MNPLPFIGLRHKFLKAPSVTAGAKQQIKHAADRQKVVAEDKILQIQNRASFSQSYEYLEMEIAAIEKMFSAF